MRKSIIAPLVGALLCVTPVMAEHLSSCQESVIANGIAFHGSLVCDPSWLDRPGSLTILAGAQSCRGDRTVSKSLKALLMRGMVDFDNSVKELGKAAACQKLDTMISSTGG
jgi:hypothetical protein